MNVTVEPIVRYWPGAVFASSKYDGCAGSTGLIAFTITSCVGEPETQATSLAETGLLTARVAVTVAVSTNVPRTAFSGCAVAPSDVKSQISPKSSVPFLFVSPLTYFALKSSAGFPGVSLSSRTTTFESGSVESP